MSAHESGRVSRVLELCASKISDAELSDLWLDAVEHGWADLAKSCNLALFGDVSERAYCYRVLVQMAAAEVGNESE